MKTRDRKLIEAVCLSTYGYVSDLFTNKILGSPEYAQFLADNPVEGLELWVARDNDGTNDLCAFQQKPTSNRHRMFQSDYSYMALQSDLFPEITFENSPVKFRLVREDEP